MENAQTKGVLAILGLLIMIVAAALSFPSGGDASPKASKSDSTLKVGKHIPRVHGRDLTLPVTCRTVDQERCVGTVVISVSGKAMGVGGKWRQAGLIYFYKKPAGSKLKTLIIDAAEDALDRRGKLVLRLTVSVSQANGSMTKEDVFRTVKRGN